MKKLPRKQQEVLDMMTAGATARYVDGGSFKPYWYLDKSTKESAIPVVTLQVEALLRLGYLKRVGDAAVIAEVNK